ncbi:NYN domain-containing protein [Cellulomonas sp. Leaf334]|uniref:NYN domain-containing protein n=1 Tax=Cellulomonas sp. Leaf334 TaxID=1736339 RepID=UPI0006F7F0C8|nr:NYN domain-containing protein [Cellulomonas sp. Leaf334]KQR17863.1 hypothetical protein ASF78_07895 [Cellulomonas sp. Leaf334]
MRVGVYVDGFNLYYGAKGLCGQGTAGWRWLDVRALADRIVAANSGWTGATVTRVVYCTARISGADNPVGQREQDAYLRALKATRSADEIAMGVYVTRVTTAPLATKDAKSRPVITHPNWPVMVKDSTGARVSDAVFMVSVARREEKGSDVNVASHLLIDVLTGAIDAAVVISNDSDLEFPIAHARGIVPVGLVNPQRGFPAGRLNGDPNSGAGSHWWFQLKATDLYACQLPTTIGAVSKPQPW